jgi:hypothetical protein
MLKIEVNQHEGKLMVEVQGNLPEIIADLGTVIHAIHVDACNKNIFLGRELEYTFRNPEFWNLVFRPGKDDAEILAASKHFGKGGNE